MTGARSQIRTEHHGQAPALTTAVPPQPPPALPCPETQNDSKPHSRHAEQLRPSPVLPDRRPVLNRGT
jgi:hypothetical protein